MAERIQQPPAPVAEAESQPDERVPAGVVLNLDRFKLLLSSLRDRATEDRAKAAGEVIDLLIAMRDPGHDAAEAAVILQQLDLQTLSGVVDAEGRNARKEAVETLMTMGFPHALKISPEDFEWARDFVAGTPHQRARKQMAITFVAMFVCLLLAVVSGKLDWPKELTGVLAGGGLMSMLLLFVAGSNLRDS